MSGQTPGITPGVPTIAPETEETKETPVGNAALAIIQDKCMSCHGSFPGSRKWINSWEYFRTNNLVVEGEPAQSSLYRYLTDNPEGYLPGYMPKGLPALSQSEIAVISAWIKSYGEGNASSGGSSGGMNNSGGGAGTNGATPLPVFAFSCGDERALSPRPSKLKRLSKKQFQNTFIQLLDVLPPADRGSITVELLPLLDGIPDDIRPNKILEALEFPGMDGSVTSAHVSSLFTIASEFARAVTSNTTRRVAFSMGNCVLGSSGADLDCLRNFIKKFGLRVFRRPLTNAEENTFEQFYLSQDPASAMNNLIVLFLLSPDFNYHLQIRGADNGAVGDGFTLSPFEIASKISYLYWQSMPDERLFSLALDGSILRDEVRRAEVERVFADPRTRDTISLFFEEVLGLDKTPDIDTAGSPSFMTFLDGLSFDSDSNSQPDKLRLKLEMQDEILSMVDYYVWNKNASFDELFTSGYSFAKSPKLAEIYKVKPWNGSPDDLIQFPTRSERRGLLGRAAIQLSGGSLKAKAHLGGKAISEWNCEDIPPPPPSVENVAVIPEPKADSTSREAFERLTAGGDCRGCHYKLNPPGFVMDRFDAIGRYQEVETIIDKEGRILARLPINSNAIFESIPGRSIEVKYPIDLFEEMVASGRAEACFATQFLRFAEREKEDLARDSCTLKTMHQTLDREGMQAMFKALGKSPSFVLVRRVD